MNLAESIRRNVDRWPEAPALVAKARSWTYRELDLSVRRAAAAFKARGVGSGDVVAICLKDTAPHVMSLLALGRIGAMVMPIDWRSKAEERRRMTAEFDPKRILIEPGAKAFDPERTLTIHGDWIDDLAAVEADDSAAADGSSPFLISLSSGTTSTARAMVATHDHVQAWLRGYAKGYGIDLRLRYLSTLPLSFVAGRNRVMQYLNEGGVVVLGPTMFTAEELVATIASEGITAILLTPPILRRLLAIAPEDGVLLPGLRLLEAGADKLNPEEKHAIKARLSPNFFETYANSAIGRISCLRPTDTDDHADSVGRPNPLLELQIVDEEDRSLAAGEVGIIRCRGDAIPTGRFGKDGAVEPSNDLRDGWFFPGDHGYIDRDGYLYLVGRAATVIKRAGISIYPEEIEPVLCAHPSVSEAAIVGRPDGPEGDAVVAFVVSKGRLSEADLVDHLRREIVGHKQPQDIVFVDALPRTPSGKVNRGTLKDMALRGNSSRGRQGGDR